MISRKAIVIAVAVTVAAAVLAVAAPWLYGYYQFMKRPEWVANPRPSPFIGNPRVPYEPILTRRPNPDLLLVGHRGAMLTAPENSLPGVRAAVEKGFDYVEIDVRYSADGVPVLMHDRRLKRTTNGSGYIDDYTYDELMQFDAGAQFDEAYAGTRIPRLDDVIDIVEGNACLYWHIKSTVTLTAIDMMRAYLDRGGCLLILPPVESGVINPNVTAVLAEHWPDAPLVLPLKKAADVDELIRNYPNARAVWVQPRKVKRELVDAAHAQGLLVVVYLLKLYDEVEQYNAAAEQGVDLIVIDHIDEFRAWQTERFGIDAVSD